MFPFEKKKKKQKNVYINTATGQYVCHRANGVGELQILFLLNENFE